MFINEPFVALGGETKIRVTEWIALANGKGYFYSYYQTLRPDEIATVDYGSIKTVKTH